MSRFRVEPLLRDTVELRLPRMEGARSLFESHVYGPPRSRPCQSQREHSRHPPPPSDPTSDDARRYVRDQFSKLRSTGRR